VFGLFGNFHGLALDRTQCTLVYSLSIATGRDITREILSTNSEIKLSVAKDGVEAIDFLLGKGSWLEPDCPTMVLLDLNLLRKDGRQVLAFMKSNELLRRIPVVVLSSSESEKDITSCYDLGANGYIVKPFGLVGYRAAVQKLEEFWLGTATLPEREVHSDATRIGYKL
jgi:two-component system, chemotaxis family, response regulator Rcp1